MSLKVIKGKTLPIGIDLGSSTVKLAQLRLSDDGIELIAAGYEKIPLSCRDDTTKRLNFLGGSIRAMLKAHPFQARQCILSLPARDIFLQHVKMPKLSEEETTRALRIELQNKLPYSVDDAIIRHVIAGDIYIDGEVKQQEVIVIAVPNKTLNGYLAMARRAKLDVIGINIESCTIVECFARLFRRTDDAARTTLFIDMGATTTQVVLAHGSKMVFARNLLIGGEQLDEAVAKGMGVPVEQAHTLRWNLLKDQKTDTEEHELYKLLESELNSAADELTQCIRYYKSVFKNQNIERAIFIGGQAYDKCFCQALAKRLNLPADIGDPLVRIKRDACVGRCIGRDLRGEHPDWAVAVGLSLGADQVA